jgi:hypothetical protein
MAQESGRPFSLAKGVAGRYFVEGSEYRIRLNLAGCLRIALFIEI